MRFQALLLTLLATLASGVARADEQKLVYDLLVGNQKVGTREVTIRYLPPADGRPATRLIDSWTHLDARPAGVPYQLRSRASARATDSKLSFTASTSQAGDAVEVQGRQVDDGDWLVTAIVPGAVQEMRYRRTEVDLTDIGLFDPGRHALLEQPGGQARVLLVETGTVAAGPVKDLGEATLTIGGEAVPVEQVAWSAEHGRLMLSWDTDGLLVGYEVGLLGKTLTARLRERPAPRTWGEVQIETDFGGPQAEAIEEQEL